MLEVGGKIKTYTVTKLISCGAFANSFFVNDLQGNSFFLKEYIDPKKMSSEFRDFFSNQTTIMARLNKEGNICEFMQEHFEFNGIYYQVKRKVSGIDCSAWLKQNFDNSKRSQLGIIFSGVLKIIHSINIVHQDLKPQQIMLINDEIGRKTKLGYRIMLSDFDWSIPDGKMVKPVITLPYASPEHFLGKTPTKESDIFTFGIMLCEFITGANPFIDGTVLDQATYKNKVLRKKIYKQPKELEHEIPDGINNMILQCLEPDPKNRPSIDQIQQALTELKVISGLRITNNKDTFLVYNNMTFGRKEVKEFFPNVSDENGIAIYQFCDPDKPMLSFEKGAKGFTVKTTGPSKNFFRLNGGKIAASPIIVNKDDKLELFSTAKDKVVCSFTIEQQA